MNKQTKSVFADDTKNMRSVDPCCMIIFGATGDLTARRLLPALYSLKIENLLPSSFSCIGFARRDKNNEIFRSEMKEAITSFSRIQPIDEKAFSHFQDRLFYHKSSFDEDEGYERLKKLLEEMARKFSIGKNRIYYLATPPKYFPLIIEKLHKHNLIYPKDSENYSRVIIEKPFGHDLESAQVLQSKISKCLDESQIYRIDHYLGKETVQNLLFFRFGNAIFESLWNANYIDHIQITVAEDMGIGTRGHFFEEQGILRDVIQNHMMQLLSLTAMEPPAKLDAKAIRDEKVKVLESILPIDPKDYCSSISRGQYDEGFINGEKVVKYRSEKDVDPLSNTETFAAIKLFIDTPRFAKVPFYLRAAKRMPKRTTEIAITFKNAPQAFFPTLVENNVLALRIQPNEGISLKINCKVPGQALNIQPVQMDFRYYSFFGKKPPDAYERLIYDCTMGDSTLFTRSDEVMASWKLITPILHHFQNNPPKDFPNYEAGTWGPKCADEMIQKDHHQWKIL